jgi:hypothetical protein
MRRRLGVRTLESLLVDKGLVDPAALDHANWRAIREPGPHSLVARLLEGAALDAGLLLSMPDGLLLLAAGFVPPDNLPISGWF